MNFNEIKLKFNPAQAKSRVVTKPVFLTIFFIICRFKHNHFISKLKIVHKMITRYLIVTGTYFNKDDKKVKTQ